MSRRAWNVLRKFSPLRYEKVIASSPRRIKDKQEKPQGALTPPLFSLPLGSKIYYGQVKVGDLSYLLRACDDNINQNTTCLITLF